MIKYDVQIYKNANDAKPRFYGSVERDNEIQVMEFITSYCDRNNIDIPSARIEIKEHIA